MQQHLRIFTLLLIFAFSGHSLAAETKDARSILVKKLGDNGFVIKENKEIPEGGFVVSAVKEKGAKQALMSGAVLEVLGETADHKFLDQGANRVIELLNDEVNNGKLKSYNLVVVKKKNGEVKAILESGDNFKVVFEVERK